MTGMVLVEVFGQTLVLVPDYAGGRKLGQAVSSGGCRVLSMDWTIFDMAAGVEKFVATACAGSAGWGSSGVVGVFVAICLLVGHSVVDAWVAGTVPGGAV